MGEDFVNEAALSAASTRRHLQLPITIFTDCPAADEATHVFDSVVELQRSGPRAHRDKLKRAFSPGKACGYVRFLVSPHGCRASIAVNRHRSCLRNCLANLCLRRRVERKS